MNNLLWFVLMFSGGIAVAIQPSINGRLAQRIGVVEGSCVSFAVGTLALLLVALAAGQGNFRLLGSARWWELSGGFLGALFVTLTILAVPRLGTASTMTAAIAAQLLTGLVLDHFGLFGFKVIPLDGKRVLGAVLLLAGAGLVFRR
jgi:bacterial/archaeal transporter family-2 protein